MLWSVVKFNILFCLKPFFQNTPPPHDDAADDDDGDDGDDDDTRWERQGGRKVVRRSELWSGPQPAKSSSKGTPTRSRGPEGP